jgi:flavin-dependent dehydrogenase
MAGSGDSQPRVLIVGAGLSGLVLAALLVDAPLHVRVLEQDLPPGRSPVFHGIVTGEDLAMLGLTPDAVAGRRVTTVQALDGASDAETPDWWTLEHRALLGALRTRFQGQGGSVIANRGEVDLTWRQGVVGGVRIRESGLAFDSDLVVLADQSDPRLAEQLGLRPDWLPTQLMHLAKQRYDGPFDLVRDRFGTPDDPTRVVTFAATASWGSPGCGLVVPGRDAVTVKVAMLLEDEMATARHIREYLDEQVATFPLRDLLDGLNAGEFVTECIPVGGYDTRPRFHTDNVLVVNDLVGITHPLNRDGLSTTLAMCQTAVDAILGGNLRSRHLAAYSKRLATEVIAPVDAQRRRDVRPPWQWATLPELVPPPDVVTAGPNSAKLPAGRGSGIVGRLRYLARRSPLVRGIGDPSAR